MMCYSFKCQSQTTPPLSKLDNSINCQSETTPVFYFSGWKGVHCDDDINECNLQFCQKKVTCTNTPGDYTCTCQDGYADKNCSTDIDDCAVKPCKNNAVCTDQVNDFNCDCNNTGKLISCLMGLGLWCLMPPSTVFQLYRDNQFYWWRKQRKPLTCRKSLTNFIT